VEDRYRVIRDKLKLEMNEVKDPVKWFLKQFVKEVRIL